MADNLLVQNITNGVLENTATTVSSETTDTTGTTDLGKDAFLQLLVCEMQNQDPLEPSSNTEWISQLATFSQLEELQSLTTTTENTQVFSLVGKQVIITTTDSNDNAVYKSGTVDYVSISGGEAKFSVNGSLYSMDNLYSIVDSDYSYNQNKPQVVNSVEFSFNGDEPEDLVFEVSMGSSEAKADNLALMIGDTVLSSDYVHLYDGKVTVDSELLSNIYEGSYDITVVFDDKNYTTVSDAVRIHVYNTIDASEAEEENTVTEA